MTPAERLEWQSELDSAMSDLDSRLSNPRRRATEAAAEPASPHTGKLTLTSELIDEIASRVSAQMRRSAMRAGTDGRAGSASGAAPLPEPAKPAPPALPDGIAIVIRVRRPLFDWKFWRRRLRHRQAMVSFSDYRIT